MATTTTAKRARRDELRERRLESIKARDDAQRERNGMNPVVGLAARGISLAIDYRRRLRQGQGGQS